MINFLGNLQSYVIENPEVLNPKFDFLSQLCTCNARIYTEPLRIIFLLTWLYSSGSLFYPLLNGEVIIKKGIFLQVWRLSVTLNTLCYSWNLTVFCTCTNFQYFVSSENFVSGITLVKDYFLTKIIAVDVLEKKLWLLEKMKVWVAYKIVSLSYF